MIIADLRCALTEPSSPQRQRLESLYWDDVERQTRRYDELLESFVDRFNDDGNVAVYRAPGRTNIIGEHTDYNGLPVLPMAIDRDILLAAIPRDDERIRIANVSDDFEPREFTITEDIEPYKTGDWGNYVKAAAQAIRDHAGDGLRGFDAVFSGDVPMAAGLSSSSAMVVVSAIALVGRNNIPIEAQPLAELLAEGEKYVGSQGGGMDQTTSLMGRADRALKIDFFPIRPRVVELPAWYRFVVANSLVTAEKSAGALLRFNRRPIECRMAVAAIKRQRAGDLSRIERLGDIPMEAIERDGGVDAFLRNLFPKESYSLEGVAELLGLDVSVATETFLRLRDGAVFPEPSEGFKLLRRCRHVLSEGKRVEDAVEAMSVGDADRLGELMNDSHRSCADDYEISCPELDRLVEIARRAGALGARLTGAGFGGCAISLVEEDRTEQFLEALGEQYYRQERRYEPSSDILYPCRASEGAGPVFD
jgi:N-acetylgalactosamine kinase